MLSFLYLGTFFRKLLSTGDRQKNFSYIATQMQLLIFPLYHFSKKTTFLKIFDHWSQIFNFQKIAKNSITDRHFLLSNSKNVYCVLNLPDRNCTFGEKSLQAKALNPNLHNVQKVFSWKKLFGRPFFPKIEKFAV